MTKVSNNNSDKMNRKMSKMSKKMSKNGFKIDLEIIVLI